MDMTPEADNLQQLQNRLTGTGNDDRMDLGLGGDF
jgi:hypothetical protein